MTDFFNINPEDLLESELPLEDFIELPTTVAFQILYTDQARRFIEETPFIRLGTILSYTFAVVYVSEFHFLDAVRGLGENLLDIHPVGYTLLDQRVLEATGALRIHRLPGLNLRGQGVLLGFVDTGIDYTRPEFQYDDGNSKISFIWDQTIRGNSPPNMRLGSVFTQENINEALHSENPYNIVPHQDYVGHGTFLASVAAAREDNAFSGIAPDAEIIAVKLKRASRYTLSTTCTPEENIDYIFDAANVMLGIQFIIDRANEMHRPVAICIALGTNFGGHDGFTLPEGYMTLVSSMAGVVICTAAGNESNARHHTDGILMNTGDTQTIEINVRERVRCFSTYIWSEPWDRISVSILSPMGETIRNIPYTPDSLFSRTLIFERSVVRVAYFQSVSRAALITVIDPTPGIWRITLHGDIILNGKYHAWLPITDMISPDVDFNFPTPQYTIVVPATAMGTITCGAYNPSTNSLYVASSWGPTRQPMMSPDFVAPGVDIQGIYPSGVGSMSGTSVSASITAALSAILLQWGVVEGNEPNMNSARVRSLLITGSERDRNMEYPNVSWGYGKVNVFNALDTLRNR